MKKMIALLLALMLALGSLSAFAATGDALLGLSEENTLYFERCFTDGDTLYLTSYNALYTWHVGDAEPECYEWMTEESFDDAAAEGQEDETEEEALTEEGQEYFGNSNYDRVPFVCDGTLYAITLETRYTEEHTEFVGAKLNSVELTDDQQIKLTEVGELDWSDMVEHYENNDYARTPQSIIASDGTAVLVTYNDNGDRVLYTMNLKNGKYSELDVQDVMSVNTYKDDTLLIQQFNYQKPTQVRFIAYDLREESETTLSEVEVEEYNYFNGLAYDPESDTTYCVKNGEICPINLQNGEVGEGVTDMPVELYGNNAPCIMNGGYYVACSEGCVVRNLDPSQRAEVRLKIQDTRYVNAINTAYMRFSNKHGEVSVAVSRDSSGADNSSIIENMMNRDDSVDIYTLSTDMPAYDALYNRGYMMELDKSEKLNQLVADFYPAIREAISYNGHLVALPVEVYSWTFGVYPKALESLGLSMDELPANWDGFLDFLIDVLPEHMDEDSDVSLFYQGMTDRDARLQLFSQIFSSYTDYMNANDPAMGYDTPMLRGLIEKLERVDFVALGCEEYDPDSEDDGGWWSDGQSQLFETSAGATFGSFYNNEITPVVMAMNADTDPVFSLQTIVAFVNPFTRNPDTCIAFMEELADALSQTTLYCLNPNLNEPIRSSWYESNLKEMNDYLDQLKQQLEAADESERQMLEQEISDYEGYIQDMDKNAWDASEEQIAWYRANAESLKLQGVQWMYSESGGEAYQLVWQYVEGEVDLNTMLSGLDKKLQMMMMEGN